MLAAVERQKGRPRKGVRAVPLSLETLKRLKLERSRAIEAQRIGCLPKIELERWSRIAALKRPLDPLPPATARPLSASRWAQSP
jgi:hypothetical protein